MTDDLVGDNNYNQSSIKAGIRHMVSKVMSIGDGGSNFVEGSIQTVNAVRGIGMSWLQFGLSLDIKSTKDFSARISHPLGYVYVGTSASEPPLPLGVAMPETNWFATTNDYSRKESLSLKLELSEEKLSALEELRKGGGLIFRLDFHCIVKGKTNEVRAFEQVLFEENQSFWTKLISDIGYKDILLLGVELPIKDVPKEFESAIKQIHSAKEDLLAGRYDSAIGRARLCLEAIDKHIDDDPVGNAAINNFGNKAEREKMTKGERANLVRAAIRHYTHLAHHVDEEGKSEYFSRHDATFIIAAAASVLWDALGRQKIIGE